MINRLFSLVSLVFLASWASAGTITSHAVTGNNSLQGAADPRLPTISLDDPDGASPATDWIMWTDGTTNNGTIFNGSQLGLVGTFTPATNATALPQGPPANLVGGSITNTGTVWDKETVDGGELDLGEGFTYTIALDAGDYRIFSYIGGRRININIQFSIDDGVVSNTAINGFSQLNGSAGLGDNDAEVVTEFTMDNAGTATFTVVLNTVGNSGGTDWLGMRAVVLHEIVPASGATLVLDPSEQLDIELAAPATLATGTVDVAFIYGTASNLVDVTGVTFSNLSHGAGSFSSLDSFPINLPDPSPSNGTLSIQYDNSVSNLSHAESATGIALVEWTEEGSGITNEAALPVVATYDDAPAQLVLSPASQLHVIAVDPAVAATGTVTVSYNEATASPTGVVITAVDFSNTTQSVFANLTPLNLELNDSAPSNDALEIAFDSSLLTNGATTATGLVVVTWSELGDATVHESILPVYGAYQVLSPVTGTIAKREIFPTNNIVIASASGQNGGASVKRIGLGGSVGYSKVTQEVEASALSGGNHTFDSLYLRMRFGNDLRTASGANQMQMWFGTIDETSGETNATVSTEVFDCSIVDFNKNKYYEFTFGSPVSFDPSALSSNESYAIQLWFTTDDPRNELIFWHSETTNTVDGGYYVETDGTASDTTFPIGMSTNRLENEDLHFALVNSAGTSIEIGEISAMFDGSNLVLGWNGVAGTDYLLLETTNLLNDAWITNVVPGEDGAIIVTNGTSETQAFYKVIVE